MVQIRRSYSFGIYTRLLHKATPHFVIPTHDTAREIFSVRVSLSPPPPQGKEKEDTMLPSNTEYLKISF